MELFICVEPFMLAAGFALLACSFRDEFFALTGILPVTYLLAFPAPFLMAGSRRARTVVDRGIIAVSSSYSYTWLAKCSWTLQYKALTFFAIIGEDRKIEVGSITKAALDDNITFELKYRDTSTIELQSGRLLLGLESVKHGGRHAVRYKGES